MQLHTSQSRLMDVGSAIATPIRSSDSKRLQRVAFDGMDHAEQLERWIDAMDEELPPLRNFILPSGGATASSLHLARAICRRTERSIVPLVLKGECDASVGKYVNRLSDYLFVAARWAAMRTEHVELVYKKAD